MSEIEVRKTESDILFSKLCEVISEDGSPLFEFPVEERGLILERKSLIAAYVTGLISNDFNEFIYTSINDVKINWVEESEIDFSHYEVDVAEIHYTEDLSISVSVDGVGSYLIRWESTSGDKWLKIQLH